jgi:hypothetical protein
LLFLSLFTIQMKASAPFNAFSVRSAINPFRNPSVAFPRAPPAPRRAAVQRPQRATGSSLVRTCRPPFHLCCLAQARRRTR